MSEASNAPAPSSGEIANQSSSESLSQAVSEVVETIQPTEAVDSSELAGDTDSSEEQTTSQPEVKKYKVKVDGQEIEIDEGELLKGYQKAKSANKRFEEAAKLKKQSDQILEALKTSPAQVLEHLGLNFREVAEKYLIEKLEEESLPPEQKELRDAKKKLEEYEAREKEIQKQREQEEYAKMKSSYETEIETQIIDSLNQSGLPKTPYTVKRMAQYLARALDRGVDIRPKDVVELVRKDYYEDLTSYLGGHDGENLLKTLPKEVIDKIRKADLARVKAKSAPSPAKVDEVAKPQESKESKPKKKMTMAELREWAMKGGN